MSESDAEKDAAFIDAVEASLGSLVPPDLYTLARRGAEMQWRPIEEAPKDGTMVLLRDDADVEELETIYFAMTGIWTHGKWHFPGHGGWRPSPWFVPLRWMLLPLPPTGEK